MLMDLVQTLSTTHKHNSIGQLETLIALLHSWLQLTLTVMTFMNMLNYSHLKGLQSESLLEGSFADWIDEESYTSDRRRLR